MSGSEINDFKSINQFLLQAKNDNQDATKHNGDDADINEDTNNDYGTFDQANVQINQTED